MLLNILAALLGMLLLAVPAAAQQVSHPAPMSLPVNNAALKAINGGINLRATRLGFTAAGDGGYAEYNWSAANCTAADDGAQVQPSVTGCWIADFSGRQPTPMIWGAKGDGTTNDTAAVQAALDARAGKTLYTGARLYSIGPITVRTQTTFEGERGPAWPGFNTCSHGLKANAPNLGLVTVENFGVGVVLKSLCIVMAAAAGTNTSGFAIKIPAVSSKHLIDHVSVINSCNGIEINGNTNSIVNSAIEQVDGVTCSGLVIGLDTTGKATLGIRVHNSLIAGVLGSATPCATGTSIYDAGGVYWEMNDTVGCSVGLKISPSVNQVVDAGMFYGVLSDTSTLNGLEINPFHSSAKVALMQFIGTWTSGNVTSQGSGVYVNNSVGADIHGLRFIGHTAIGYGEHGFNIQGGQDLSIINSVACANSFKTANIYNGIHIAANVSFGKIIGNKASKVCEGYASGEQAFGLYFGGDGGAGLGNLGWVVTDNDFGNNTVGTIAGAPSESSVVANNRGVDDLVNTVASTAHLVLPDSVSTVRVTGTTPISRILQSGGTGPWYHRRVVIIPIGAVPFVTGGADPGKICADLTATPLVPVTGVYSQGDQCWFLK